jgi:hypothetical protein
MPGSGRHSSPGHPLPFAAFFERKQGAPAILGYLTTFRA